MKRIRSALPIVSKILGVQAVLKSVEYRLSRHILSTSCEDGILFFHTLTEAMYLLDTCEKIDDYQEELIREYFLVPVDYDENKLSEKVDQLRRLLKTNSDKWSFTIFTTTDCNARCYYCYEKGINRISMSDEVAYDISKYIIEKCKGNEVKLRWFGGEPLYNKRPIDIITECLTKEGIHFSSEMISNGYYLDEKTCAIAKENWRLKKVQITLDGTKEKYLKTKRYIENDLYSYERVLDNIKYALLSDIEVLIRLNMDRENADDLFRLVYELNNRFGDRELLKVYVALIKPLAGEVFAFEDEMEELETYQRLSELVYSLGLNEIGKFDTKFRINHCMADDDRSEVLLPDGRIGKCEHYSESEIIGSIYNCQYDDEMIQSWKEIMPKYPECEDCPLHPRCNFLKKCDYTESGCKKTDRLRRERSLIDKMQSEYKKYKQKSIYE